MNLDDLTIMEPVIPDSIEPYKGYKALSIDEHGQLWSPSETTLWPPRAKLEAHCTKGLSQWTWVPVEGKPREMDATAPAHGRMVATSAMWSTSVAVATNVPVNIKPSNPLPPGWSWSWEPLTHDAPAQGCNCGIHSVARPADCLSYIKPNGVIVEIAVWGNVIPASNGSRGQYAYPQSLLAPSEIVDELKVTAELYGIPIIVLDPPKPPEPEPDPQLTVNKFAETASQSLAGQPMQPAQLLGEMITSMQLPPAVEVKAEDPVLKAIKDSARKLRKKDK